MANFHNEVEAFPSSELTTPYSSRAPPTRFNVWPYHIGDLRRQHIHVVAEKGRVEIEGLRVGIKGVLQSYGVQVQLVVGILVAQPSVLCFRWGGWTRQKPLD